MNAPCSSERAAHLVPGPGVALQVAGSAHEALLVLQHHLPMVERDVVRQQRRERADHALAVAHGVEDVPRCGVRALAGVSPKVAGGLAALLGGAWRLLAADGGEQRRLLGGVEAAPDQEAVRLEGLRRRSAG